MLKSIIVTSDLPTAGEISMNGLAAYRILSDFRYSPSSGSIETNASKKSFLNTDTGYISEAPQGNLEYFCANGTHGRLIMQRGSYPCYSILVSIVKHQVNQNPYDVDKGGCM